MATADLTEAPPLGARTPGPRPAVDVVVPVYNEEADLGPSVRRLHAYLRARFPFTWRITIADNASTDGTPLVAAALAAELPGVRVVRLEEKGRGRALRTVWSASDADGPRLHGRRPLDRPRRPAPAGGAAALRPQRPGHRQPAGPIGARRPRPPARDHLARLQPPAHAGAARRGSPTPSAASRRSAPTAPRSCCRWSRDSGWFFDTELLVLAERTGLRIHEVPVDWVDDPDSRVDIVATALEDLKGVARLGRDLATGRLPVAELRTELRRPGPAGRGPSLRRPGPPVRGGGRREHPGLPRPLRALPARRPGPAGERGGAAAHRPGQHRRQPPVHVRRVRSGRRRPAPRARPGPVRSRPGAELGGAGRCSA